MALIELYTIQDDEYVKGEFELAWKAWNDSFFGLHEYYRNFYLNSDQDLSWLDHLKDNMTTIMQKHDIQASADAYRQAILEVAKNQTESNH